MDASELTSQRPYLAAACECAKWINQARVITEHGIHWRLSPDDDEPFGSLDQAWSLGMGATGIVLFMLELYRATRQKAALADALAGADYVASTLPFDGQPDIGLYYGVAGAAYMLELAHQVGGRTKDREAALRCLSTIRRYVPTAEGQFFGRGNDIHNGRAGFGLTLLWLHRNTGNAEALELALLAGKTVLQRARRHDKGGMYWFTGDSSPEMTGFALGSAGMAYFLTMLYEQTGERAYLDTAIEAARHIQSMAIEHGDGYLIDPTTTPGADVRVVYGAHIGWYQGVTGIWRLFFQLGTITGDPEWVTWVHSLARGAMALFPKPGDGIYENDKPSHAGNAHIAQSFLELHTAYRNPEYLRFAEYITGDLLRRAIVNDAGMHWEIFYQRRYLTRTCFINGAAGIGTWLAHLDEFYHRQTPLVVLPDSPFQPVLVPATGI